MKKQDLKKYSAILLAASLGLNPVNTKAVTYDKDEVLEKSIDDYKNGRKILEGEKANYQSSILSPEFSFMLDYDINNSDYPVGASLFKSDEETKETDYTYYYTNKPITLGSYVLINGDGSSSSNENIKKTKEFKDTLGVVVGIKDDKLYKYAIASISKDDSLGDVIGWFKEENVQNVIAKKYLTYKKQADVARVIAYGEQIGHLEPTEEEKKEGKHWGEKEYSLPCGYEELDGSDNCRYGIKTNYEIPSEYRNDDNFNKCTATDFYKEDSTAIITGITEDADTTLEVGDIVLEIDGQKVTDAESLKGLLLAKNPGDNVTLKVYRNGKEIYAAARIQKDAKSVFFYNNHLYFDFLYYRENIPKKDYNLNFDATDVLNRVFNPPKMGIEYYTNAEGYPVVTNLLFKADTTLKENDIIIKIDDIDVNNPEVLISYIKRKNDNDTIKLKVIRDGKITDATSILYRSSKIRGLSDKNIGFDLPNPSYAESDIIIPLDMTDVINAIFNKPKIGIYVDNISSSKVDDRIVFDDEFDIYHNEDYTKYIKFNPETGKCEYISISEEEKIEDVKKLTRKYNINNN